MPFDSGISRYVHTKVEIDVYFPVDERGAEFVRCEFCKLYNANTRRCSDTGEIIPFPGRNVGGYCRLKESEENQNG